MNTKSRPAKINFVPGASRAPRSITTLRAQMEDLARGERIKTLRTARRLTQPAVVELLRQKAGAPVVTLRGYQAWEGGGGIRWDNAKVLAGVFDVDPEYIMSGRETADTPDLSLVQGAAREEQLEGVSAEFSVRVDNVEAALERIERAVADRVEHDRRVTELLDEQNELLAKQSDLLDMIREVLGVSGDEPTVQERLVGMFRDAAAKAAATSPPAPRRRPSERTGSS